jgi:hypothetical protein
VHELVDGGFGDGRAAAGEGDGDGPHRRRVVDADEGDAGRPGGGQQPRNERDAVPGGDEPELRRPVLDAVGDLRLPPGPVSGAEQIAPRLGGRGDPPLVGELLRFDASPA